MSEFSKVTASGDSRGHCKGCKHWQAEHDGPQAEDRTVGLCVQPELTHFSLQVSGDSGCNRYEPEVRQDVGQVAVGVTGG